jgi:small subunit ribosomal protein S2
MTQNTKDKEVELLFKANAHLGHRKNRLHPKARKYVYKIVNNTTIIDLPQTVEQLETATNRLTEAAKEGDNLLVVATKRLASPIVSKICAENKIPYITTKWLPGLLTNFDMIMKNVKKLNQMEKDNQDGSWDKFVKHEIVKMKKEMGKLKKFYGGIAEVTKKPDMMLLIDIRREKNALKEAKQNHIPTVAILDTNSNPNTVDYPIVANDDSTSSLEYLIQKLLKSYIEGRKQK